MANLHVNESNHDRNFPTDVDDDCRNRRRAKTSQRRFPPPSPNQIEELNHKSFYTRQTLGNEIN